ncbi:6-phosphofructokinase [Lactobacillus panisapium]|uniref:ATP-dependent 6-phosphofructokinase n=1 Tax=Lactobacillus panisapium TaxID=2012495 RepID=A0ABX8W5B7_9LACO|nr:MULTISPECIES: 6-phosphofructokinase [Lactobacillus]MCO6530764.1 6-phosphofructokinase [Lactobacillus sp.]MCO6532621.1 6-phosphofructokinase [Lactobacillus sp.]MCT6820713.1 6-phosphofructokinase [Lactobacillus panisapium]MCT6853226.1 6-phosphofructokinase [Lactobacillus panisapium]MCX8722763.1 6-phosphofructokinase [Lactobacillus sp. B4005]
MKRIGILTSGGDAPGMNAAVRAVTKTAIHNGLGVVGIRYGFAGLVAGDFVTLTAEKVDHMISLGGTFLYSARFPEFAQEEVQKKGVEQLKKHDIDTVIVIGGDGSYHGALALTRLGINSIGLPGTIDNDIPCTDYTIGLDTACNTALEAIDKIRDTASSHHRVFIVNVMGRGCGDIAMRVGLASGADAIVVPERPYDIKEIAQTLTRGFAEGKDHGIIVLAEGVMDADEFRTELLKYGDFDARANILGHMQRGGSPTVLDRINATKMGNYAVKLLLDGKGGLAVGMENGQLETHDILDLFDDTHRSDETLLDINDEMTK